MEITCATTGRDPFDRYIVYRTPGARSRSRILDTLEIGTSRGRLRDRVLARFPFFREPLEVVCLDAFVIVFPAFFVRLGLR